MEFPPSTIDELLSGMLDGALSEAEAGELARAMRADPSLQSRLDELSLSRTALLKGRSRGRLGSDFSSKVSKLARSRAMEMGEDAPEWLRSKPNETVGIPEWGPKTPQMKPQVSRPDVAPKLSLRPWLYAGALATATVFVLVFASIPKKQTEERLAVRTGDASGFSESETTENDFIPMEQLLSDQTLLSNATHSDKTPSQPYPPQNSAIPGASRSIAENLPNTLLSLEEPVSPDTLATSKPSNPNPEQSTISNIPEDFVFTLVLDITVDKVALENRALDSIFKKYGIVYADDLVIDEEQLKALEDSRLVESKVDEPSEKIGVMFLASTAEKISLAITDISDQYKDFPEFSMSMSFDKSAGLLMRQLNEIKVSDEASGVVQRLLPQNYTGKARSVATSLRKAGTQRLEKLPFPSNSSESQEKSYFLLLIRSAK